MDTKKKMSNRDKMIILIFAAIIIVAATYFLVFAKLQEKKTALAAENATLAEEVKKLEVMESQKAAVLEETADLQDQVATTLEKFPSEIRTENAIFDLNKMYTDTPHVKIQSENFTMNEVFYRQGAVNDGSTPDAASTAGTEEGEGVSTVQTASGTAISEMSASQVISAAADFTGYRSTVNVAFTAPYKSLKEVVNFINNEDDRMTISEISATKDEESNALTCSMVVDMYAVSNNGQDYEEPEVDNGAGVDNIFRN